MVVKGTWSEGSQVRNDPNRDYNGERHNAHNNILEGPRQRKGR